MVPVILANHPHADFPSSVRQSAILLSPPASHSHLFLFRHWLLLSCGHLSDWFCFLFLYSMHLSDWKRVNHRDGWISVPYQRRSLQASWGSYPLSWDFLLLRESIIDARPVAGTKTYKRPELNTVEEHPLTPDEFENFLHRRVWSAPTVNSVAEYTYFLWRELSPLRSSQKELSSWLAFDWCECNWLWRNHRNETDHT